MIRLRVMSQKPKASSTDDVFEEMSYEHAEELVADKITAIIKARGSNTIGLNGSGQLTMEAQWIENVLMKGDHSEQLDRGQRPHVHDLGGDGLLPFLWLRRPADQLRRH